MIERARNIPSIGKGVVFWLKFVVTFQSMKQKG